MSRILGVDGRIATHQGKIVRVDDPCDCCGDPPSDDLVCAVPCDDGCGTLCVPAEAAVFHGGPVAKFAREGCYKQGGPWTDPPPPPEDILRAADVVARFITCFQGCIECVHTVCPCGQGIWSPVDNGLTFPASVEISGTMWHNIGGSCGFAGWTPSTIQVQATGQTIMRILSDSVGAQRGLTIQIVANEQNSLPGSLGTAFRRCANGSCVQVSRTDGALEFLDAEFEMSIEYSTSPSVPCRINRAAAHGRFGIDESGLCPGAGGSDGPNFQVRRDVVGAPVSNASIGPGGMSWSATWQTEVAPGFFRENNITATASYNYPCPWLWEGGGSSLPRGGPGILGPEGDVVLPFTGCSGCGGGDESPTPEELDLLRG